MKKYIILVLIFISAIGKAQFTLEQAFPNLPAFTMPTELVMPNGTNKFYLIQQEGLVYVFNNLSSVNTRKVFLDLSNIVTHRDEEFGLLGLAFHPNYLSNRYIYTYYIFDSTNIPGADFWARISRFQTNLLNPDTVLLNTQHILLTEPFPNFGHAGGKINFGPDGYLYVSIGDATADSLPHGASAQLLTNIWGKILRINVDSASGAQQYSIPSTNPFYGNTQGYKKEIYAYGFRNVWKFNFDSQNGRLWAGDVGEDRYEEIDIVENGKNYGWNKMEGTMCYPDSLNCDTTGRNFIAPIVTYPHTLQGRGSVTGGQVYRGNLFPNLYGKYIYCDFIMGKIWSLTLNPVVNTQLLDTTFFISSINEDESKELYFTNYFNGRIYKFRPINTVLRTLNLTILIEGFYNPISNTMVNDTVMVLLRVDGFPFAIDSTKGVLNNQGQGIFTLRNIQNDQDYRIVVKHRNSIETWSNEVIFQNDTLNYNFTTLSSQAYGNNQILKSSRWCIYSGDVNQNGIIDASDLSLIENAVFNSVSGYVSTDLTGDNFVDASDLSIVGNNIGKTKITPL